MHECRWEASAELTIPADWISGVYLGRLTTPRVQQITRNLLQRAGCVP
ncbi:MAG TPA: hypothetical protein PLF81_29635 [Candidatus Anammoximicrobium sp.]|nr:hypothetical protein [Candidatus Anammoximicrobium sp.]